MKRIAIVSASIGSGHNQVAKYVKENLQRMMTDAEVVIYDLLAEKKIYQFVKHVYLGVLDKTPGMYSKAYYWSQKQKKLRFLSIYNYLCYKFLQRIQLSFGPDIFIFTHPFPVASYKSKSLSPAWAIITDYGFHPFWYNPQISGYFAGNEQVANSLAIKGYPKTNIHVSGIPVSQRFLLKAHTTIQKGHLQNIDVPNVLIMGGGLGIGSLVEILESLDRVILPFKGTVLTGKNAGLYSYLHNKLGDNKQWEIIDYTNKVDMYMKKASFLITKAGAVTLTEASVCGLPIIIYKPIPGHEEENARYFCMQKRAYWAKGPEELVEIVNNALANPKILEELSKQGLKYSKPYAAREISRIILEELVQPIRRHYEYTT
jgi:processive 1,2-diacylglycerol beta-glucosyltransferase